MTVVIDMINCYILTVVLLLRFYILTVVTDTTVTY